MAYERKRHYGNPLFSNTARCGVKVIDESIFEVSMRLTDDIDNVTCAACLYLIRRH